MNKHKAHLIDASGIKTVCNRIVNINTIAASEEFVTCDDCLKKMENDKEENHIVKLEREVAELKLTVSQLKTMVDSLNQRTSGMQRIGPRNRFH